MSFCFGALGWPTGCFGVGFGICFEVLRRDSWSVLSQVIYSYDVSFKVHFNIVLPSTTCFTNALSPSVSIF